MKILFAVPPYNTWSGYIPNGTGIVATVAKEAGLDVSVLLATPKESPSSFNDRMVKEIKESKINVVATACQSSLYGFVEELIHMAKEAGAITVLGGYIVDASPELVPDNIGADYCIYGEGEYTFVELINALEDGSDLKKVNGIIYKKSGKLITAPPRECTPDLDALPFVDGELCHFDTSLAHDSTFHLYLSRSCPYECTFCYHLKGAKYRTKSIDYIFREIDHYLSLYGNKIRKLFICDELLCVTKSRLLEFCSRIKSYNLPYQIHIRVDCVDEESLIALKSSGAVMLVYGLESASNKVLKSMKKEYTIEQAEKALALTHRHGIGTSANLIIGDIEDDLTTIAESEEFYKKYALLYSLVTIRLIRIFPGTVLYTHALRQGKIKDEIEFMRAGCPYINVSKIPDSVYGLLEKKYASFVYHTISATSHLLIGNSTEVTVNKTGSLTYTGYCPICYTKIQVSNLIGNAYRLLEICPKCSRWLYINELPVLSADVSDVAIISAFAKSLLQKYVGSRVAIWGLNHIIRRLLFHSQELRDMLVRIVDVNYLNLTHLRFCDLPVENPEVLKDTEFDCIIIGAIQRRPEIEASLDAMGLNPEFIEILGGVV